MILLHKIFFLSSYSLHLYSLRKGDVPSKLPTKLHCISHLAKSLALVRKYTSNSLADLMVSPIIYINFPIFWLNPRPISNHQLNTLLYLHLGPIYLVVFKGSYCFHMRYPILRGASRLDAFSVYPVPT